MSDLVKLLSQLRIRKIKIWIEEGNLRIKAPKGALPPDILKTLQQRKPELIEFLSQLSPKAERKRQVSTVDVEEVSFLNPTQQNWWVRSNMVEDATMFNHYQIYQLDKPLDSDKYDDALKQVIAKVPQLSYGFVEKDGRIAISPKDKSVEVASVCTKLDRTVDLTKAETDLAKELSVNFTKKSGVLWRCYVGTAQSGAGFVCLALSKAISTQATPTKLWTTLHTIYHKGAAQAQAELDQLCQHFRTLFTWEDWQQKKAFKEQYSYWETLISDGDMSTEITVDFTRPQCLSHDFDYVSSLDHEAVQQALIGFQAADVDLPSAFLYNFIRFVNQYSLKDQFFCATNLGGPQESNFGHINKRHILACDLNAFDTQDNRLTELKQRLHVAAENNGVPLEVMIDELTDCQSFYRNPIYQTSFFYFDHASDSADGHVKTIASNYVDSDSELCYVLIHNGEGLEGRLYYNTNLFDRQSVENLLAAYERQLVAYFTADVMPTIPNGDIRVLQKTATPSAVLSSKDADTAFDLFANIEKHLTSSGDQACLSAGDLQLTYADFAQQVKQAKAFLLANGVKKGDVVGLSYPLSVEQLALLFGLMSVGAISIHLFHTLPEAKQIEILEAASVSLVISADKHWYANAQALKVKHVTWQAGNSNDQTLDETIDFSHFQPRDVVTYVYSSLPVDSPRITKIKYETITEKVQFLNHQYPLSASDRCLKISPFLFCGTLSDIFWPLSKGASLILDPFDADCDMAEFTQVVQSKAITHLWMTPSFLHEFLLEPKFETCTSIKQVFCLGEHLNQKCLDRYMNRGFSFNFGLAYLYTLRDFGGEVIHYNLDEFLKSNRLPAGCLIGNQSAFVLDQNNHSVVLGAPGDLYLEGTVTEQDIISLSSPGISPFINFTYQDKQRQLYATGEKARMIGDNHLQLLNEKLKHKTKLGGYHFSLKQLAGLIANYSPIQDCVVLSKQTEGLFNTLEAFCIPLKHEKATVADLKAYLIHILPKEVIPEKIFFVDSFPDRYEDLLHYSDEFNETHFPRSYSEVELDIAKVWGHHLRKKHVKLHENFFDLGGTPVDLMMVYNQLPAYIQSELKPLDLFNHQTIHELGLFLEKEEDEVSFIGMRFDAEADRKKLIEDHLPQQGLNVAVVGVAGRFPGADDAANFWSNLVNGVESITFFSQDELQQAGVDADLFEDPFYVKARAVLSDIKGFDASFFGFNPREAQTTDPQHRIFLEVCHHALEDANCRASEYDGRIGVFAGAFENIYVKEHLEPNQKIVNTVGHFPLYLGNDRDFLATKACFNLGLRGPGVAVQSACTTSALAIHLAALAVRSGNCDMAIAGGVSLGFELGRVGYMHEPGMLASPDGHCRPFDVNGEGTVPGQGSGVVVLKKLEDAIQDGDHIYAVLRGSAVNNDGNSNRANFSAPGTDGQPLVVAEAYKSAGIDPETVTYIEASTTASQLGEPIEVNSLKKVFPFEQGSEKYCALGGVKANIGILDHASGVAAFIKAAQAVKHKTLPANIHFNQPNPKLELDASPFYVNNKTIPWNPPALPRRAGVSSFGMGGTNVHLVLEGWDHAYNTGKSRPKHLLTFSAKTSAALDKSVANFVAFLKQNQHVPFANICYSMHIGREDYNFRKTVVCANAHEAILELEKKPNPARIFSRQVSEKQTRTIGFMFPGQGVQYQNMGRQLYQTEIDYRETVEHCWKILERVAPTLYNSLSEKDRELRTSKLHQTYVTQPVTFITEYALATLLGKWGITPDCMIGNSLGEYVAACLAGVMSLEDAIKLVSFRGELIQRVRPGAQLAAEMSESEIIAFINQAKLYDQLSIAGIAGPKQTMISGETHAISELKSLLEAKGHNCYRLFASKAFHSFMMEELMPTFIEEVSKVRLHPPKIPFVSTITGDWITDDQAVDPKYWADQLRHPVRFSEGLGRIMKKHENMVLIEIGPDKQLYGFAIRHPEKTDNHTVLATMRQPHEEGSDEFHLLTTLGRLWLAGVHIDWEGFHDGRGCYRVPLPGYPFERKKHWIDTVKKVDVDRFEEEDDEEDDHEGDDDHYRPNVSTDFVGPRDPEERKVARFWKDFLGLEEVGIYDDFFELGGSSLIGLRLLSEVGKDFGVPLASHILLQKRTVADLTEYIKSQISNPNDSQEVSPLIELQKGSKKRPTLYMMHPIGGEIYYYRDLSDYLGREQGVIAYQAESLTGHGKAYDNLVEQASDYIDKIVEFQKKGPYLVGGASYGGGLAFEMACQMIERGLDVPLVVMIDTPGPGQMPVEMVENAEILIYLLGDKLPLDIKALKERDEQEQLDYVFHIARESNLTHVLPPVLNLELFDTWKKHQVGMFRWKPREYQGRVVFFRHTAPLVSFPSQPHLPWIDLVKGGIQIHQIPGTHITMNFGENAKTMSKILRRELRKI